MHAVIIIVVVLIVGAAGVLGYAMYLASGSDSERPDPKRRRDPKRN
jgi:flagellar basal body-associated protein FliL